MRGPTACIFMPEKAAIKIGLISKGGLLEKSETCEEAWQ